MSWTAQATQENAVSKNTALEVAKAEALRRVAALKERERAYQRILAYGEPKVGKSGFAMDWRTEEEIENGTLIRILDFDNGCEPTWRTNWDSDPNIEILHPIVRDNEGYPDLSETILLAEAWIQMAKDSIEDGENVKFVFDGIDKWLNICFLAVQQDKRSTNFKFLPVLWGSRNKTYDDLIDKVCALPCDVYFITHMKDKYEGINNPNPTGRMPDIGKNTMAAINQELQFEKKIIGNKTDYYVKVISSKTNTALVGKEFNILTINAGEVEWTSVPEFQAGKL